MNVKLVYWPQIKQVHELEFTKESKKTILETLFFSIENNIYFPKPSHYENEFVKIETLRKYKSLQEIKEFMFGAYLDSNLEYDKFLQQLQVRENPVDSQLKLRLLEKLQKNKNYKVSVFNMLVNAELEELNYKNPYRSNKSLVEALGIEIEKTSVRFGAKVEKVVSVK